VDDAPVFEGNDFIFLHNGDMLRTHAPERCEGGHCCIHNPSEHPLRDAPLNWRADRYLMERVCTHGIGHPDLDDLAYKKRRMSPSEYDSYAFGIHGCDACCRWPRIDRDTVEETMGR
jgi:hypothetical protein